MEILGPYLIAGLPMGVPRTSDFNTFINAYLGGPESPTLHKFHCRY